MKPKHLQWCVLAFVNADPLVALCVNPMVPVCDARFPTPIKAATFAVYDKEKDAYHEVTVSHRQILEGLDMLAEPPTVPARLIGKRRRK